MEEQTLIFLGPSGSGKGTQVRKVKEYISGKDPDKKIVELVMGDLFRSLWKREGYVEELSREINLAGGLQPSFLQINLWSNFLLENMKGSEHLIIDGSPRRLTDLRAMESAFVFFKRKKPTLVFLNISREESIARLTKRAELAENPRPEDSDPELISKRYDWFLESVMPVIEEIKNNDMFTVIEVDGKKSVEAVAEDILSKLTS